MERHVDRKAREKEQKPKVVKAAPIEVQKEKIKKQIKRIKKLTGGKNVKKTSLKRELISLEKKFQRLNEKNDKLIDSQAHNQKLIGALFTQIQNVEDKYDDTVDENEKKLEEFEKKLDRYIVHKFDEGHVKTTEKIVIKQEIKQESTDVVTLVKKNVSLLEQKVIELKQKNFNPKQIKILEDRLNLAKERLTKLEPKVEVIKEEDVKKEEDHDLSFLDEIPDEKVLPKEIPEKKVPHGKPLRLTPPGPLPLSTDIGEPDEPIPAMADKEITPPGKVKIPKPADLGKKKSLLEKLFKKKK